MKIFNQIPFSLNGILFKICNNYPKKAKVAKIMDDTDYCIF